MSAVPEPQSYEEALTRMLVIAQAQWGPWIRSYWFYKEDQLPRLRGAS